jgi:DNA topoisomerase IA
VSQKSLQLQGQLARYCLVANSAQYAHSTSCLPSLIAWQRQTGNKYIKNFDFDYPHTNATFTVTSVSGHLLTHDFPESHRTWLSCDPFALFDAPVEVKVASESKAIEKNLVTEAKRANMLMIWTDCDREGEHIGAEVAKVCRKAKAGITVKRARFSAIIAQCVAWFAFAMHSLTQFADKFTPPPSTLLNLIVHKLMQ